MPRDHGPLAERVRALLADRPVVREVAMFGGLSFMVGDKLVVNVRGGGDLLARVDPEESAGLVAEHGARVAEMGAGRSMGPSWLEVPAELVESDDGLRFWVGTALAYVDSPAGPRARRSRRR